jgi:alanyl-tRNA synthetase
VILDRTNFYAEMGGQVGDSGELRADSGALFEVETARAVGPYTLHIGHVRSGRIRSLDSVTCYVMGGRDRTEKNHTSTHLANWALRETLGDHVQQKGSLVDPEKLRFDFVHQKAMGNEEIEKVESLVNAGIAAKLPVYAEVAPQEQALKIHGLRAVFGEKYPPMVRVVSIGVPVSELLKNPGNPEWRKYSVEFCGGTHLRSAAEAERFIVTAEESVSKGVRRIVALTGEAAIEAANHARLVQALIDSSGTIADAVLPTHIAALQKAIGEGHTPLLTRRAGQAAILQLQERLKKWQKSEVVSGQLSVASFDAETLLGGAVSVGGVALIVATVPDASADTLRNTWDWLKKKHPQQNVAVLLASEFVDTDKEGNKLPAKVNLLAGVGDPFIGKLKAGDWVKAVAPVIGGTGGGRPQLAMAGGKDVARIPAALEAAREFARAKLG